MQTKAQTHNISLTSILLIKYIYVLVHLLMHAYNNKHEHWLIDMLEVYLINMLRLEWL